MDTRAQVEVAVLLPTYNGSRYVESQLKSLTRNTTRFVLHWLDDHSSDDTREAVRNSAKALGLRLREWHQPNHQGVPGTFFKLLECVEADIYLFCDQDDIWQEGKIDATVDDLFPDKASPALCFSDALVFNENEPEIFQRAYAALGTRASVLLQESRMFITNAAMGNTIGFTRPLRDIVVTHSEIARGYAAMHDWWLYVIGVATGRSRMLPNAPTTLYRVHAANTAGVYLGWRGIRNISRKWELQQAIRRWASRQAQGFCLAAESMPASPKLQNLLTLAKLVARIDRRQSLADLFRLARRGTMPPTGDLTLWLAAACLCSNASK